MPVRSSSASGPSGTATVGRAPRNSPTGGAKGNITARMTAEWSRANQWPSSCASSDSRSYAPWPCGVASAPGVAKVAWPSLRNSVSASRIWPANAAGPLEPAETPGALAVITRVNASTPLVNPALGWSKQIVLRPSTLLPASFEQEFAAVTWVSGARRPGFAVALNVDPLTPDHTPNVCEITESISDSCALVCGAATVRIVAGDKGSVVLQRLFSGDARERFQRSG